MEDEVIRYNGFEPIKTKIKIIDLLNLIEEGKKVPKKIKINGIIYEYQGDDYLYKDIKDKEYWLFSEGYPDRFMWLDSFLRAKAEIIEEDNNKIEKLIINEDCKFSNSTIKDFTMEDKRLLDSSFKTLSDKINDIIDKINNMQNK